VIFPKWEFGGVRIWVCVNRNWWVVNDDDRKLGRSMLRPYVGLLLIQMEMSR
jgi:hypothetical protein